MFQLGTHLKTTKTLSWISGVYWSARDFKEVANHHFITFIYESEDQAIRITRKWKIKYQLVVNDMGVWIPFSTMSVTTDTGGKDGNIIFQFNPGPDLNAIFIASRKVYAIVSDLEGHRVPYKRSSHGFLSNAVLMDEILQRIYNFNSHYKLGYSLSYDLDDRNCATVVNSIFRVLGFPLELREDLGEFEGIDWGEEDKIPAKYFEPIGRTVPNLGVEISWRYILSL